MMPTQKENLQTTLNQLFKEKFGILPNTTTALPQSGSSRQYFRLEATKNEQKQTAIAVFNDNLKENETFIYFTDFFVEKGVKVPQIYAKNLAANVYLLEDLGDLTLLNHLQQVRQKIGDPNAFPDELTTWYKKVIEQLVFLQIKGAEGLDYTKCYLRQSFDKQAIMWDLNYFKYYFLKLTNTLFDEQQLEEDFNRFADHLLANNTNYFLFRDFQARNIMIHNDNLYFIDYQGGMKGALQYDLASLLYQAKAAIPQAVREQLLDYYLEVAATHTEINQSEFKNNFYAYTLVRTIQVLGAYGFRGLFERKKHFLKSIPFALDNLKFLLQKVQLPIELPELWRALTALTSPEISNRFAPKKHPETSLLTVRIQSFSYKRDLPEDPSGNGGGYIFDCRAIHNPGRYQPYKKLTGRDQPVIDFLKSKSTIYSFLNHIFELVDGSMDTYLERNFTHLMVSFGCTGGQHRSVYSADQLAAHLKEKYGNSVNIELSHIEQERKGWKN